MPSSRDGSTFQRIIVGVDLQEGGRDALALAALLQRAGGGELTALYVYPYDLTVPVADATLIEAVLPEDLLAKLGAELYEAEVQARPIVVNNPTPARALHAIAERDAADVIVVGSSHLAGANRILAGDDAIGTLHGAPCAVAIAPRGFAKSEPQLRLIGAGFDASPESRAALKLAAALCQGVGGEAQITAVIPPPVVMGPLTAYRPQWPDYEGAVRREAQERVDSAAGQLAVPVTGTVEVGTAGPVLVDASADLDLLVLGSRAYGPLRRLIMGSTSSHVARHAACPVLVLPRGAREVTANETDSESSATAVGQES